ncbi:class I SAM-dependent DNA methyltransferase [Francisella tularensis subsp. novicida]|uniref:DNA methyltransferase n=1 Tax=Francisella tularensis TaxID=263 RepID=UPI0005017D6A|nr:DNA methyltransferase [Francisella tularensis]AJJ47393.1 N-6 DNA Methylase family protein [Francisella tularensis subsp. novicida]KFJ66781.1 N-6 DNA Methylase family protein [Francisella tularensis subsp. novicida]MBK2344838.1 class I SAM-dependent DNA methyltransferase [Francisella tularensis subsp. novicida]MBK2349592.1 class I SAM-dependent DNA methyltransferase [Francisella tularensis subsp. novicida]MBK2353152.1 class I SAM-dependent DNA methyltransferase [Francisella tularensis subsp.
MNIIEIEKKLNSLIENFNKKTFIFTLLEAYDFTKTTIARAKKGSLSKLEVDGSFTIKKKLYFLQTENDVHLEIDSIKKTILDKKDKPRFIIVTDYTTLLAYDTKTDDSLDIPILELDRHYDFFLPWVGMEKSQYLAENPADIKAAAKMAKLYDEILKVNALETAEDRHYLNVFLTRLLFCYFAEDTNIFPEGIFTHSIESHTKSDGSDLDNYLERLFEILNTEEDKRPKNTPAYLDKFPYVNGGLFKDSYPIPPFTAKARKILIEVGKLQWSEINPDIFGSMVQAVIAPEHRAGLGMHYTSVPNIMKVINPLFLDELYEEFDKSFENVKKLRELIERISKIKVFDPACGSGNFLIIAYKKLRELEIAILQKIDALSSQQNMDFSQIRLDNFYGIEIDDFAHEVAILSMWLVEHQMNLKFYEAFGRTSPTLPLKAGGNIVAGNATRLDWEEVCPKNNDDEIYLLGNPPYLGSSMQDSIQKEDMSVVFKGIKNYKSLDYIACWFYKGAKYIYDINAKLAFVSTNSISQGEQVSMLWPHILDKDIEISFAHQSFKWQNNAKSNAAVIVVVIGLRNISNNPKYLYYQNRKQEVKNINPYLINSRNIIVSSKSKRISKLPLMSYGCKFTDGGNLILSLSEKDDLLDKHPEASNFVKRLVGSQELIKGQQRWCLFIEDKYLNNAKNIPFILNRLEKVSIMRRASKALSTVNRASTPHKYESTSFNYSNAVVVPRVSSERRKYIPIGYADQNTVVLDSAQAIYNAEPWIFGVLSSLIHNLWMKTVGGKLKLDYRYSSVLCYNTFPFPDISQKQKDTITELVFNILDEREKHSEKTLAQLYDPDKMPAGLREAHHRLDLAIEQCYRKKPFESDEERLEYLFKMYEKMVNEK